MRHTLTTNIIQVILILHLSLAVIKNNFFSRNNFQYFSRYWLTVETPNSLF